jgi:hypothetical protein
MNQAIGAAHSGGSCQIALSYDNGKRWVVVQSYEGDCPRVRNDLKGQVTNHYDTNQNYTFKIPESFPSGDRVIVAWLCNLPQKARRRLTLSRVWINATGKRELYMSCSCVMIKGSGPPTNVTPNGPPLFIANLQVNPSLPPSNDPFWRQCNTKEGTSIIYPKRYEGINPVIVAPKALNLQQFSGPTNGTCGSDNENTINALRGPKGCKFSH